MIQIKWDEVKYDVDQQTWYMARVHIKDDAPEERDAASTDDSSSSSNLVLRFAESAAARLVMRLKDKLVSSGTVGTSTDELDTDKEQWTYTFSDGLLNRLSEDALAMLMHRFVVRYVLWQWCKMFFPEKAAAWDKECAECLESVEDMVYGLDVPKKVHRTIVRETSTVSIV